MKFGNSLGILWDHVMPYGGVRCDSAFTKVVLHSMGNILVTRKKSFSRVLRKFVRGKYPFLLPFLSKLDFQVEISDLVKKF